MKITTLVLIACAVTGGCNSKHSISPSPSYSRIRGATPHTQVRSVLPFGESISGLEHDAGDDVSTSYEIWITSGQVPTRKSLKQGLKDEAAFLSSAGAPSWIQQAHSVPVDVSVKFIDGLRFVQADYAFQRTTEDVSCKRSLLFTFLEKTIQIDAEVTTATASMNKQLMKEKLDHLCSTLRSAILEPN